jgi:hypothetical protein
MGRELGRRPVLGAMAAAMLAVALDGLPASAATDPPLPGGAIPSETLRRIAERYNGAYVAKWVDSSGKHGGGAARVTIDPQSRRAQVTGSLGGGILGRGGLAKRHLTLDLSKYGYDAQTVALATTPWGPVAWERVADGAKITLRQLPGAPGGSTVEVVGRFTAAGYATFTYTITPKDGAPVRGAVNAGRTGTTIADPVVPAATAAATGDLLSGAYACRLFTKAEATQAFGEPAKAAENNGGRIGYQPGIDTSNCRVETVSKNQLLQMTVFHGQTHDAAAQYFELNRAIGAPVDGLADRAYSFQNGRMVWVLRGNDVVQLEVNDQRTSDLPPALGAFTQLFAKAAG